MAFEASLARLVPSWLPQCPGTHNQGVAIRQKSANPTWRIRFSSISYRRWVTIRGCFECRWSIREGSRWYPSRIRAPLHARAGREENMVDARGRMECVRVVLALFPLPLTASPENSPKNVSTSKASRSSGQGSVATLRISRHRYFRPWYCQSTSSVRAMAVLGISFGRVRRSRMDLRGIKSVGGVVGRKLKHKYYMKSKEWLKK